MKFKGFSNMIQSMIQEGKTPSILSLDLETVITSPDQFLTNEKIIAISASYDIVDPKTEVFIAENETEEDETSILNEFDDFIGELNPDIIIGYNHTGYDLPLLQLKMRRRKFDEQLWNVKYYLGTSYTFDMMYAIADDLEKYEGDYKIRKLKDVVNHPRYSHLPLFRQKNLVEIDGMNIGEAVKHLWKNDRESFINYCTGDTRDILLIFKDIFIDRRSQSP